MRGVLASLRGSSLEDPNTRLDGQRLLSQISTPGDLWGPAADGDPMRIGTAFRCVQIIAGAVAGCPIKVTDEATHKEEKVPALVAERPGMTPLERVETVIAHLALWGNAFERKHRTRDGRIVELVPIHPSRVTVKLTDGSAVGMPFVKKFTIDGKVHLTEYDILHTPGLSMDGIEGLSVIGAMRRTFELTSNAERAAARMYESGLMLAGFLTTEQDLTPEKADILKARWRAKTSGVDAAGDVAVMDKGMTFKELAMSPADAQFLESRKFQTTEVSRLFGIPSWMVNDQEKSTSWGTGMEQMFTSFVTITLKPYMQRYEQRLTREVVGIGSKAEFKVEGLLRGDSKARAEFYGSAIQHGWMVPNEPRELEDLPPVPWGDEPYRPFNKSASDSDSSNEPTGVAPAAEDGE